MRQVVLDTETTGLEVSQGHRIIEIGCVEIFNRKITNRTFHYYLQPDRDIEDGALEVHGITKAELEDKPRFYEIAESLMEFIVGAELIIHNAPFDVGFIDYELQHINSPYRSVKEVCSVLDTLELAREMHPGQKNSLDALCKRYHVDNSNRDLHGALLDAKILAEVYLAMTGGQASLVLTDDVYTNGSSSEADSKNRSPLQVIHANDTELAEHSKRLEEINRISHGGCLWLKDEEDESTV